jgi:hypothetical protein
MRHVIVLLAAGFLMVQLSLKGFRKIPFACSYLPGKANMHVRPRLFAVGFLFITTNLIAIGTCGLAAGGWAHRRNLSAPDAGILFDEGEPADIEVLNLHDRNLARASFRRLVPTLVIVS